MYGELNPQDLNWCVRRLPKEIRARLKTPELLVVGGGFIRACIAGERVSDVDVFGPTAEYVKTAAKLFAGKSRVHESENAITVRGRGRYPIQFIHRWAYEEPLSLLESFDFTIAKAAIWWRSDIRFPDDGRWTSACHSDFYADLAAKRLVYTSPERNEDAGGSLLRVLKFYQRGYRIPLDSLAAVIARLMRGVDPERVQILSRDLTVSSEEALGMVLTGLLREVDPAADPSHEAHLPAADAEEPA